MDIIQVDAEVTESNKCVGYTRRRTRHFTEIVKYTEIIIFICIWVLFYTVGKTVLILAFVSVSCCGIGMCTHFPS
jgi:hypothetical protein